MTNTKKHFLAALLLALFQNPLEAMNKYNFGMTVEERNHRLMIVNLDRKSKAFDAGLRRGDFILGINGRRLYEVEDLKRVLSRIGNKSLFYISRQGYKKEVLLQFHEDFIYDASAESYNIGFNVEEVDDGLFIRNIKRDSQAYGAGLDNGDIIVGANGYRVRKVQHLKLVLDKHTDGELMLFIKREGRQYKTRVALDKGGRRPQAGNGVDEPMERQPAGSHLGTPAPTTREQPRSDPAPATPTTEEKPKGSGSGGSDYDKLLEKFSS